MTLFPHAERYVADTHAMIWHLTRDSSLSTEAKRRFLMADHGEAVIYLSVMTVIEILYLHEKGKIPKNLWKGFSDQIRSKPDESYQVVDLTYELAQTLPQVPREVIPELPDRVIAATAYFLSIPAITKDHRLHQWEGIVSIW